MVRLTVDVIARGTSGYTKKKRDEDTESYLKRLTHLYLEEKSIDEVGEELALCKNLSVLYLYDNQIKSVPELSQNYCLTHLYLQNNRITEIRNLSLLKRLTKLYIGGNLLTVVEGLDQLEVLEELHVENQQLPSGEKLLFDPRSLHAISRSLRVLNVSGNNLDSLRDFYMMVDVNQFMAAHNKLADMREVAHVLDQWRRLWRLELEGNPLCQKSKYRDRVIIMSNSLEMLDGKEITKTSRQFLQNWKASKEALKKKRDDLDSQTGGGDQVDAISRHEAAKNHLTKISSYVMPGLPKRQFEEVLARSAANLPSSDVPPSAPVGKTYSHSFVSSPNSYNNLQKAILEQHGQPLMRTKSHEPRLPPTLHF